MTIIIVCTAEEGRLLRCRFLKSRRWFYRIGCVFSFFCGINMLSFLFFGGVVGFCFSSSLCLVLAGFKFWFCFLVFSVMLAMNDLFLFFWGCWFFEVCVPQCW